MKFYKLPQELTAHKDLLANETKKRRQKMSENVIDLVKAKIVRLKRGKRYFVITMPTSMMKTLVEGTNPNELYTDSSKPSS